MNHTLSDVVDLERYPLSNKIFRRESKRKLDKDGALVMSGFLTSMSIASIVEEGKDNEYLAYYTKNNHNIYLKLFDQEFPLHHVRNREVCSSKGCIAADQIPSDSVLRTLYDSPEFRGFLCAVLDETELYEYADNMSSINLHYASEGQELGWHFDNSSFAVTLMIQNPVSGGIFEYVKDVRDAKSGDMNYQTSGKILDGEISPKTLSMDAGALVMFRGQNSIHRVTPVEGDRTRMLVVFAYNTEPGISLSESARMTFFGRLE